MCSFEDFTHSVYDEPIKSHLYGRLHFLKTVGEILQAIAASHEKFAQDLASILINCKSKAQNERPKCGSNIWNFWDSILSALEADVDNNTDFAKNLQKVGTSILNDFFDNKMQHMNRLYGQRSCVLQLIQKNSQDVYERHRDYSDKHGRYRASSNKINKSAMLQAHNDYVLQLQATNAMIEEFHSNQIPQIMKELGEIDASTSAIFSESTKNFVTESASFAEQKKLRYDGLLREDANPNYFRLDTNNFIKNLENEIGHPDRFGREPWILEYRFPPFAKGFELPCEELVYDKLVAAELQERLRHLEKQFNELQDSIQSAEKATQSNLEKSNQDAEEQSGINKSTSTNQIAKGSPKHRFLSMLSDRKLFEISTESSRKSFDKNACIVELAAVQKQILLISKVFNSPAGNSNEQSKKSSMFMRTSSMNDEHSSLIQRMSSFDCASLSNMSNSSQSSTLLTEKMGRSRLESATKLLNMSTLKQTLTRWRKNDNHISNRSKSNKNEPDIDPIYSLLRCATKLPRRPSSVGYSAPKTPTIQRQPSDGDSPTNTNYNATGNSGGGLLMTVPNHSVLPDASNSSYQLSLAPKSTPIMRRVRSFRYGISTTDDADNLRGSIIMRPPESLQAKLSNMRSVSVDEGNLPLTARQSEALHSSNNPQSISCGSSRQQSIDTLPREIGNYKAYAAKKSDYLSVGEQHVSGNIQSTPRKSSMTQILPHQPAITVPKQSNRNFTRKMSSSLDLQESQEVQEIYISMSTEQCSAYEQPARLRRAAYRRSATNGYQPDIFASRYGDIKSKVDSVLAAKQGALAKMPEYSFDYSPELKNRSMSSLYTDRAQQRQYNVDKNDYENEAITSNSNPNSSISNKFNSSRSARYSLARMQCYDYT